MAVVTPIIKITIMVIQSIQIESLPGRLIIKGLLKKSSKNIMPRTMPKQNLMNTKTNVFFMLKLNYLLNYYLFNSTVF